MGLWVARVVSGETVMAGDEIVFELPGGHRACDCGLLSVCGNFPWSTDRSQSDGHRPDLRGINARY